MDVRNTTCLAFRLRPIRRILYTGFISLKRGLVAKSTIAWGVGIIRWMKKSMHSVSYTHLDVYKRQPVERLYYSQDTLPY